jgi:hypothetical protein
VPAAVRAARKRATCAVAAILGKEERTVEDACGRQLGINIAKFDELVLRWLNENSSDLQSLVLGRLAYRHFHLEDKEEEEDVRCFFDDPETLHEEPEPRLTTMFQ